MDVNGGLNADGSVAGYDFATRYPSNGAPTLALLLTGAVAPVPAVFEMGDRTAIPPYDYDAMRVVAHDMPPIVRASWFRGVSALPNTFAHESYIDELATEAGVDHSLLAHAREQYRVLRRTLGESADYLDPIRAAERAAGVELRG
jgi:nicotinate dehydrogenase subunit B